MGRLVINNAMTVNGAYEAPVPEPGGWLVLDPYSQQASLEMWQAADAMVMGRRTYEGFVSSSLNWSPSSPRSISNDHAPRSKSLSPPGASMTPSNDKNSVTTILPTSVPPWVAGRASRYHTQRVA